VPDSWSYLAPDGGLRIARNGGYAVLQYAHLDGTTETYRLPAGLSRRGLHYSVVANTDGVVVAASPAHGAPKVAVSTLTDPVTFRRVRTSGLPHHRLVCTSFSGGAIGCIAGHRVVRLSTHAVRPQVIRLDARPLGVAVTDGYTSWTAARSAGGTCPCTLASSDTSGTAASIVSGLTSAAITSGDGRFYFSSRSRRGDAGVYVNLFAGAGGHRVAAAARRPLHAGAPALGAGQAVWTDDSRSSRTLWADRVRPDGTGAGRRARASDAASDRVAVSGSRIVYRNRHGMLQLRRHGHSTSIGKGSVVALSGTRLLVRRHGELVLRDLVSGAHTNESARHGAVAAALWGPYLSYVQANGSVWRVNVARPDASPRRLVAGVGHLALAAVVYSWGSHIAWSVRATRARSWSSGWRDASDAVGTDLPGLRVFGASAGGPIVGTPQRTHFMLLSWRTGQQRAALPGSGSVPSVDANTVAWLRHGRPTIASLGTHVRNQPHALGLPSAPRRVRPGRTWRLDLPTSAPLTTCAVRVRRHGVRQTLSCRQSDQRRGEILVRWPTGSAPPGRYRWTVSAAGSGGTLLGAAGGEHPFRGSVTVR
jgi:hypothetical protein